MGLKSTNTLDRKDPFWQQQFQSIVSRVSGLQPDCQIFVFGSYVEGHFTDESDLDVAVIVPDGVDTRKLYKDIYAGGKFYEWPLDLLILPKTHYSKQSLIGGVSFEIRENGREIYPNWRLP